MDSNNQIIIYLTEDGQTQVDVRLENETVWLSTSQMAMLFDKEESNIRRHVINVFKEGELAQLQRSSTVIILHVMQLRFEKFRVGTTDFSERGGGLED